MKTAIYTRVSTPEQLLGLESQRQSISLFLASKGIKEYAEYIDHGISAKDTDRPRFKDLLKDANQGKVERIVVWKLDRLSRKLSDLLGLLEELKQAKIALVSIHDNIDTTTATGIAMMQMIGVFAELERNMCSERTKAALATLKASGVKLGAPETIGRETKEKIIKFRSNGLSYRKIAKELKVSATTVFKVIKENL